MTTAKEIVEAVIEMSNEQEEKIARLKTQNAAMLEALRGLLEAANYIGCKDSRSAMIRQINEAIAASEPDIELIGHCDHGVNGGCGRD